MSELCKNSGWGRVLTVCIKLENVQICSKGEEKLKTLPLMDLDHHYFIHWRWWLHFNANVNVQSLETDDCAIISRQNFYNYSRVWGEKNGLYHCLYTKILVKNETFMRPFFFLLRLFLYLENILTQVKPWVWIFFPPPQEISSPLLLQTIQIIKIWWWRCC